MIRLGLIGYGYWGPNLARCFSEAPGAMLAAVHDCSPDALRKAGQRYPHARMIGNRDDLLREMHHLMGRSPAGPQPQR